MLQRLTVGYSNFSSKNELVEIYESCERYKVDKDAMNVCLDFQDGTAIVSMTVIGSC